MFPGLRPPALKTLWWIAFGVQTLAALLAAWERHGFTAAGLACLAGIFYLLATSPPQTPPWRAVLGWALLCAAIALLVVRLATGVA